MMSVGLKTSFQKVLKDALGMDVIGKFGYETDLRETGVNSLTFIKAIVAIENEFEFEFLDDELDMSQYENFQDLIDFIERKKGG